jgi:hypothetical protein
MLKIASIVQQIMTEPSEAVSEKHKLKVITKIIFNLMTKILATVYRPLKFMAFNENSIWRRRYELSKQLQNLHVDIEMVAVQGPNEALPYYIHTYM